MIRCLTEFLLQSWKCWHNSVLWFLLLLLTEIYRVSVLEFSNSSVFHTDHTYISIFNKMRCFPKSEKVLTDSVCKIMVYMGSCWAVWITLCWSIDLGGFSHLWEDRKWTKKTPTTAHWPVGFLVRTTSHSQLSFSTSNCSGILNFLSGHMVHVKLSLLKQNTACAK